MTAAATALQIQNSNILPFAQICISQQTSTLSLAVIIWRQLVQNESDSLSWNNHAGWALTTMTDYKSLSARNFDMMALWFTGLRIVENKLFNLELPVISNTLKKLKKRLKDEGNSSQSTPNLRLACRACSIYLERLLTERAGSSVQDNSSLISKKSSFMAISVSKLLPNSNLDIPQMMEQLQKLQAQEMYSNNTFNPFFMEIETILTPLCDYTQFKSLITKTLFPFAPYLSNT